MKRIAIAALIAAPLFLSPHANAVVDMKNSNYAESFIDISVEGSGIDFKVQRYYNSRSTFSGIFGYGWCSDFETAIERTPEGALKVQECGAGQETTYRVGKGEVNLDSTVNELVEYAKKNHRGSNQAYYDGLKAELLTNAGLRVRWAKEAKIKIPDAKKGATYVADTLDVEKIQYDGQAFTRTLADGTSQKFDTNGHLTFIYDKNGNYVKMSYNNDGLIKDVLDNNGRKLTFSFYPNKRVKEIAGTGNYKSTYQFKGEDLSEVKNMWGNVYTFQYDDVHNLSRETFPDKTFKALTYNKNQDWVLSFTDRVTDGVSCTESYDYEMDKQNPRDHYWSTAVKKCGKDIKNQARYEFWYKKKADGSKFLARVVSKSNNESLDVTYHQELGRPTSITKNGIVTTFGYYPSGLIEWKQTGATRMTFEYKNQFNKVSHVATDYKDLAKKLVTKRETTFKYDAKANLTFASNSDGQTVNLTYDTKGRIASITDQAKKVVLIQYEEKTGKPSVITRPKMGTIKITYKSTGEIDKVDSKDGPTVAVQVASTFNNLLDIIAPATSELNL